VIGAILEKVLVDLETSNQPCVLEPRVMWLSIMDNLGSLTTEEHKTLTGDGKQAFCFETGKGQQLVMGFLRAQLPENRKVRFKDHTLKGEQIQDGSTAAHLMIDIANKKETYGHCGYGGSLACTTTAWKVRTIAHVVPSLFA
jgi:hypothetical protein